VLHQDINQHLLEFLSQYSRSEAFSHFGSELTDEVKSLLGRGNDLYAFFLQGVGSIVPSHVQYVMVALIWLDTFPRNDDQDQVIKVRDRITELYLKDEKFMQLVRQAVSVISFDDLLNSVADVKAKILEAVGFVSNNGNNKGAKNG
jgi:F0F1-type ATP synthase alpha subunit